MTITSDKSLLTQRSTAVSNEEAVEIAKKLKTTLFETPQGVGISAVQIGIPKRVFVIRDIVVPVYYKAFATFINPRIIWRSKEMYEDVEGCLSLPNIYCLVPRNTAIKVRYITEQGNLVTKEFTGMYARIIQHEWDHLEGVLITERGTLFDIEKKQPLLFK